MKIRNTPYYKILSLLVVTTLALTGCRDDELYPSGNRRDPNAIAFSAYAMPAQEDPDARSGEEPEYEPLVLTGEGFDRPLYLHTWDSDQIGYRPGEHSDTVAARGCQVTTADGLKKFHKTFRVFASLTADGKTYIPWTDTRNSANADNIWYTEGTHYWPGEEMLDFRAVSPAAEFDNLVDLALTENTVRFSYTARKGDADNDAEHQPDLLFAGSTCNKPGSVEGCAPLKFHHALSAVKFAIRDVMGGEVVNVKIANVKSKGNCVYTVDPETGLGSFEWTDQQGSETYSQNFNYDFTDRIVDPSDDTQDEVLNDRMPEKTFMMIPQEISPEAEIIVTLKRNGMTPEEVTLRGKILDNNVTEWKPGHEYVYTISTSKSNWVYVFNVGGNHRTEKPDGAHGVTDGDYIYVYSPIYSNGETDAYKQLIYLHDTYGDEAPMYVQSFRYRANNQKYEQPLPWKASHEGTDQYRVRTTDVSVEGRYLTAEKWITSRDALQSNGSTSHEEKILKFTPHHQITDWDGDAWMQKQAERGTKTDPWDLSTCALSSAEGTRSTANCYVIDRGGWYCLPLAYGNSIKNNGANSTAYSRDVFVNHKGKKISSDNDNGYIPKAYCKRVGLLWTEVINAITDFELREINGVRMMVFKVDKDNIIQGNSIVALFDSETGGEIAWSWHIWFTEHWLDSSTGKSNYNYSGGDFASFKKSQQGKMEKEGWRLKGDVLIDNQYVPASYGYYIAPYNIGWCDPKSLDYLKRKGKMTFVQYMPDGVTRVTVAGEEPTLKILQDGALLDYRYGNNPYYQWGRKDPFGGFIDHEQKIKPAFGDFRYEKKGQPLDTEESVLHPNVLFIGNAAAPAGEDWTKDRNHYFWNIDPDLAANKEDVKITKSVYDPSPVGYSVPPPKMYEFIGPCNPEYESRPRFKFCHDGSEQAVMTQFNGIHPEKKDYTYVAYSVNLPQNKVYDDKLKIWFPSTGHRWWKDGTILNGKQRDGGDNFNAQMVYLWTGDVGRSKNNAFSRDFNYVAVSMCLGLNAEIDLDDPNLQPDQIADGYVICAQFQGRKTMARPVRPIREQ